MALLCPIIFSPPPFPSPLKGEGFPYLSVCYRAVFHKTFDNILNDSRLNGKFALEWASSRPSGHEVATHGFQCTGMRVGNQRSSGCGTYIKVCPWSKPYTLFHRAVGWTVRHSGIARSLAIWGDDLLGYGKPDYNKKCWYDLEDVAGDGILQIPASTSSTN